VVIAAISMSQRGGGRPDTEAPAAAEATAVLVIDALPWAEVLEVADDDGKPIDLPVDRSTPVGLSVAPGECSISLQGPDGAERVERGVVARPGNVVEVIESFARPDAGELLQRYGL
jgi:hypothetical protein